MTVSRGIPSIEKFIPFSRVMCDGDELKLVREVLESGWLTTASKTLLFEEKFAQAVNAKFSCAVNSCTAGLHLALEALGVGPGDKVFVPTMTFTASAEVVRYLGADPIFLDVEYGTNLVTADILRAAVVQHPGVKALVVVHFGGQAAPMIGTGVGDEGLLEICRKHNIKVVEDAAHAFPSRYLGKTVGSIGDITCFSFYANKTITTGEGGMVTTDDPLIAERIKVMRLHGIDRDIWDRFVSKKPSWEYDVIAPGYKYNMPDLNAAIGLAQLERFKEFHARREYCARYYLEELSSVSCIDLPKINVDLNEHSWHLFPIVLNEKSKIDRSEFIETLVQEKIGTSVHYKPLHRMSYYRDRYSLKPEMFPNAEKYWRGCVSLPIYPSLVDEELEYIANKIKSICCDR